MPSLQLCDRLGRYTFASRRLRAVAVVSVILAMMTIGCGQGTESVVADGARTARENAGQLSNDGSWVGGRPPLRQMAHKPPLEISNSIGMRFRLIPAGTFMMGSETGAEDESPVHEVRITKPFYMGVTEVTQEQWEKVVDSGSPYVIGPLDLPMDCLSWTQAITFCQRLSASDSTYDYRLPTEAEWEYACRAGTKDAYYGDIGQIAWYRENSHTTTHRVAQKQANAFRLHDMSGNVFEWCQDWYDRDYYHKSSTDDPTGPDRGEFRVYRGGSEGAAAEDCRSAKRFKSRRDDGSGITNGLRVVLVAPVD